MKANVLSDLSQIMMTSGEFLYRKAQIDGLGHKDFDVFYF